MFSKVKFQLILGVFVVGIGIFVSRYLNNHSFVSDKFIKQKTDSIATLKKEVILQDSLLWSLQQDLDICNNNTGKAQINQRQLNDENKQLKLEIKRLDEALGHYEENGLMRYFVFDNKGWFQKGCFKEQFEKPDNICK